VKGELHYRDMTKRLVALAGSFGRGLSAADLRKASQMVRLFGERLKGTDRSEDDKS
jgi:hypothetical protein